MKITGLSTFRKYIELKESHKMRSALGVNNGNEFVVLRLHTDEGVDGLGEATITVRWSGEVPAGCEQVLNEVLQPVVIGLELGDFTELNRRMDEVCSRNWFAKSALEMACWDVLGKVRNLPVYELLGGAVRPLKFENRFSMGAYSQEHAARRAAELVNRGFRTIKVKVGTVPQEDVARVRAVREVIGFDRDLVIDANCGWDVKTAIDCVQQLADCRLDLVEQPTPDGDYQGMAKLRQETGVKVLADDICFDLTHAKALIENDACDAISVYPGKNGGISRSVEILDYAAQHGIACSIGSNLEWDIAISAMAHLVVAHPNMKVEEYPGDVLGPSYYTERVVSNPVEIKEPYTTVPSTAGLGVGELLLG
ncbi:MAG: muconate cycloisomerase [Planctomycetaceae bacterium]|nr:muconate cycloisomerase [Planctomycetaceae bacterium]